MPKPKAGTELFPGLVVGEWVDGVTGKPLPVDKDGDVIEAPAREGDRTFRVVKFTKTSLTITGAR